MIQDILPKHLYNQYKQSNPQPMDTVFFFSESSVLGHWEGDEVSYPIYEEFISGVEKTKGTDAKQAYTFTYLFSIDEKRFFLAQTNVVEGEEQQKADLLDGYEMIGVNLFRNAKPKDLSFAAITAYHLYGWYRDNQFCGRCGRVMEHDQKERMMRCNSCNNMVFPKISPAVIVGIIDKDRILLTKYANGIYRNYALIAGFTEIGETIEETVRREVMEEVGLKVKNIQYYKSQPWALSGTLLSGFFCELDGEDTIHLQEDELSVGEWFRADQIDFEDDGISLTREMILKFKSDIRSKQSGQRMNS